VIISEAEVSPQSITFDFLITHFAKHVKENIKVGNDEFFIEGILEIETTTIIYELEPFKFHFRMKPRVVNDDLTFFKFSRRLDQVYKGSFFTDLQKRERLWDLVVLTWRSYFDITDAHFPKHQLQANHILEFLRLVCLQIKLWITEAIQAELKRFEIDIESYDLWSG